MIAAFDLNSTWTPLVGGLLVSRLGTARSSIVATSAILLGQIILLIGDLFESVICMSIGLFIFGLGVSPLAVAQVSLLSPIACIR
jgi:fucose permease